VLTELCDAMRPLAAERGLALEAAGPGALPVEGDGVKTYRIAQNLITNAVKYTERGRIAVSWEAAPDAPAAHWVLVVQDTGPGLKSAAAAPLARALKAVTEDAQAVGEQAAANGEPSVEAEPPPLLASQSAARSVHEASGEGMARDREAVRELPTPHELHTEPQRHDLPGHLSAAIRRAPPAAAARPAAAERESSRARRGGRMRLRS
jgi:hypothetical protein